MAPFKIKMEVYFKVNSTLLLTSHCLNMITQWGTAASFIEKLKFLGYRRQLGSSLEGYVNRKGYAEFSLLLVFCQSAWKEYKLTGFQYA